MRLALLLAYQGTRFSGWQIQETSCAPLTVQGVLESAVSRIAGWCAHRMEEMLTGGRIMRPAYRSVVAPAEYVPISARRQEDERG